jgi:outer membrane receptor protein involved in Fe transport
LTNARGSPDQSQRIPDSPAATFSRRRNDHGVQERVGVVAVGDYRIPGLSRWVINSSVSYQFESGFGGGLGGSWQSEQPGNLLNEYHIPAQIFLNAFLFYRQPKWEVNLDILNVLDRRNWIHNGDTWSNNMLVFQDLPLRFEGYVKYKF